jgi:predicted AlkP superfamily phosphohydrolase/phosphomutase
MLGNSVAAAALATCYVLILVLQLNPRLPLNPLRLAPLAATVGLFYLVHLTVFAYAALVVRRLFARDVFSPAWLSVGVLWWLGAAAAAGGAAVMWANLRTFSLVLPADVVEEMARGATALGLAACLFVGVGLARRVIGSEPRLAWGICLAVVAGGSVAVPMLLRGRGALPPLDARALPAPLEAAPGGSHPHVTIIALDAASLGFVTRATAEGHLPNFGRILDAGAVMHLATLHPTSPEAVWSAVATGKLPQKNGVRSAASYRLAGGSSDTVLRLLPDYCFASRLLRFGFVTEEPHTSAAVIARTLWSILSAQDVSVGVINWPLTYPAPPVRGYVISDAYSRLTATARAFDDPALVYPPEIESEALKVVQQWALEDTPVVPASTTPAVFEALSQPARTDRFHEQLARLLATRRATDVTVVRYQSLDPIGHYFLRYAVPFEFGDVSEDDRQRYGSVLERHYQLVDDAIGRAIEQLGPADLLLVVSGYGMEPLGFGKRMIERLVGDPAVNGTHETAPDGFLMAYGAAVAPGRVPRRASVVDVTPTILYFLGLPLGRDMDGYARADLFQPMFTDERPISYIPTYER